MSDRNLRESTKKVTEKQKKKSEIYKEIEKSKQTSKKLSEICRQEKSYIWILLLNLQNILRSILI